MFSISVCMIIKNEQETLARILECAKKFADEIIIVDTGSTDESVETAKKFTNKVFHFDWCNDFSKARNYSFSKATCDYQMWLDADDVITIENINKINRLKNSGIDADVFMFKYSCGFDARNTPILTYYRERLLKRKNNFLWQGFVHEVIVPQGHIEYCDIEIEHRKIKHSNPKRNLNLYRNAKKQGKEFSAREQYYYARELFYNNYITTAIKNLNKFLKMPNTFPPDNLGAYLILCDCLIIKKQYETALKKMFICIKKHIPTAEMCCKIGYLYDLTGDTTKAIFWYKFALQTEKQKTGFVQTDYENIVPLLELTRLYYKSKNFGKAKEFHQKAKEFSPNHPSVLYNEQFFK